MRFVNYINDSYQFTYFTSKNATKLIIGTLLLIGGNSKNEPKYHLRSLLTMNKTANELIDSPIPRIHLNSTKGLLKQYQKFF